jgi:hypothetical protein
MVNDKYKEKIYDNKIGADFVMKKVIGAQPTIAKDSTFIYRVRDLVKSLKEGDQTLEIRL